MSEPLSARRGALLLACVLACGAACAQPALQPSTAASAAERAQRESDRTMYWIRVVATRPAPAKPAPAVKPVAAVTAAAKPVAEARDKALASSRQTPTTPSGSGPAPVAALQASPRVDAPAGDPPEPSALSNHGADEIAAAGVTSTPPEVAPAPAQEPDPGLVQLKLVQPQFPVAVVDRLQKGHVEVRFEVEPGGAVVDANVVGTSSPRLNSAALEAVRQWRFQPTPAFHTAMVDLVFDVNK